MRIGLMHGGDGASIEERIQRLINDENDGFDNAWFGQVFDMDSMTIIAMAGPRTSRIKFGTAIIPTYTRHPWAMAQQAMTVQAATNNRFTLGVGPSHQVVVEMMWGQVTSHRVAHGRGSDRGHTGFLESFSNDFGSNATSSGAYSTLYSSRISSASNIRTSEYPSALCTSAVLRR